MPAVFGVPRRLQGAHRKTHLFECTDLGVSHYYTVPLITRFGSPSVGILQNSWIHLMGASASLPTQEKLRKIVWLKVFNASKGEKLVEDTLDDVFSTADKVNHDGMIGKDEFKAAAIGLGFQMGDDSTHNSAKLDEMLSLFDTDHNGLISLQEFKDFVTGATKDFREDSRQPLAVTKTEIAAEKTEAEKQKDKNATASLHAEIARKQIEFHKSRGDRVGPSAVSFKVFMNLAVKSVVHEHNVFDTVAIFAKEKAEADVESPENQAKRNELRSNQSVVKELGLFFAQASTLCDADHDGKFNKPEYGELHRRLVSAITEEDESKPLKLIDVEDDESLEDDWLSDSKGDGFVDQNEFMDSMYEIADMWCESCDVEEYVECLAGLRRRIFGDIRTAYQTKTQSS
jgi:Ca2+-binding EF-hand superfamily protein